jgi:CBS domain containing-hemolysin-like protein
LVDTRASLWKLAEELSLDIPESPLYETVGGFVCDLFGSIPEVGASITTNFAFVEDEDAESTDEGDTDSDGIEVDGARRSVVITVTEGDVRRVNEVKLAVTRYRQTYDEPDEEAALVG